LTKRVAIDGRTLQSRPLGGVGRALHTQLGVLDPAQVEVHLLLDRKLPPPERPLPGGVRVRYLSCGLPTSAAWMQTVAALWTARRRPDVFHGPFSAVPVLAPGPKVVTVYDLTFLDHPEWFRPAQRWSFRWQARLAVDQAVVVVTGSHHGAGRLRSQLGVPEERIEVVPPLLDAVFTADFHPAGNGGADSAPPSRPFVVAVGGAPRRRLDAAVATFERVHREIPELALVVVGPEAPPGGGEGVSWAGPVSDLQLACLLQRAAAFVYPTAYEGFGLPALEAAATGTPVVAARVGALPEVMGPAACWAAAPEPAPMAEALLGLLGDPGAMERLGRAGRERAAAFADAGLIRSRWTDIYRRAAA
jgi:glycosyltransferase involved in cell wall biosynthesis